MGLSQVKERLACMVAKAEPPSGGGHWNAVTAPPAFSMVVSPMGANMTPSLSRMAAIVMMVLRCPVTPNHTSGHTNPRQLPNQHTPAVRPTRASCHTNPSQLLRTKTEDGMLLPSLRFEDALQKALLKSCLPNSRLAQLSSAQQRYTNRSLHRDTCCR